jgi:hypothetical protein
MNFSDWLATVPEVITGDSLWKGALNFAPQVQCVMIVAEVKTASNYPRVSIVKNGVLLMSITHRPYPGVID